MKRQPDEAIRTKNLNQSQKRTLLIILIFALIIRAGFVTIALGWKTEPHEQVYDTSGEREISGQTGLKALSPQYDELSYVDQARGYVFNHESVGIYWPPGAAAAEIPLFKIFGKYIAPIRIEFTLFSVLLVWLTFLLSRELLQNVNSALIAAGISTIYGPFVETTGRVTTDIPFLILFIIGMIFAIRTWRTQKLTIGFISGLAFGLAAYCRPTDFYIPPILIIAAIYFAIKVNKKLAISIAAIPIIFGLTVLPWFIRNYQLTDHIVLMSCQGGAVMLASHNPHSYDFLVNKHGTEADEKYANEILTAAEWSAINAKSRNNYQKAYYGSEVKMHKAVEWIKSAPMTELQLSWIRFKCFFQIRASQSGSILRRSILLQIWLVEGLGLIGLFIFRRKIDSGAKFAVRLAVPLTLQFFLFINPRYRFPLDPFFLTFAAAVLGNVFYKKQDGTISGKT